MTLTAGNIALRMPEPSDLSFMASVENNPDFWTVSDTMAPFSEYALKKFITDGNDVLKNRQIRFIITYLGERAGIIDLFDWHPLHARASVGILVIDTFRRKGIAGNAIKMVADYAAKKWMVQQLGATIHAGNHASISVFQKSGFERCGVRKNWFKTPEGWQDEYLYVKSLTHG
jgi:diamine N-acetyltransferase